MANEDIQELIEINREILKWIIFSNLGKVKEVLETILDSDDKRIAYQLSDGINTSSLIAEKITPHQTTVADWWKKWYKLGIADAISVPGGKRAKRLFDLDDLNIKTHI